MTIEGRIFKDRLQSMLHRLPDGDTTTPCGLFEVGLNDQLFEDSVPFAHTSKCAPCYVRQNFTDLHTSHCCLTHGCKYGNEMCTVTRGVAKQQYECEWCTEVADAMKERGEHYEYGIVRFGGAIDVLPPGKTPSPKLIPEVKVVRRRVSEWEEVER